MAPSTFLVGLPCVCALLLCLPTPGKSVVAPVVPDVPFAAIWNVITSICQTQFQVSIDLDTFHIVANPGQVFKGPNMTIFYSTQLGLYPSYTSEGQPVNGGLPQNASFPAHLAKAYQDILNIYREHSREMIREKHPDWYSWRVESKAIEQFEGAAKAWMLDTLKLGESLRPEGLWGYYGFPDCYNYNFQSPNYMGQCPPGIENQNDLLQWMWEESCALYPSIYLSPELASKGLSLLYVRSRLQEAFRVAGGTHSPGRHILPYAQIFYETTNHFLSLEDLEQSIGESAAQGADGIVLWVSWQSSFCPQKSCQAIKDYMDTTLSPFLLNVSSSSRLCSQALCSGHGRCARRTDHPTPSSSLAHPASPSGMANEFECRCYSGWDGKQCDRPDGR
uniref:Hyaluronidase n=1 Tax=Vombatus ursinus TaxID=29139 RepID=A0A4X2LQU7_VOMUR